MIVILFLAVVPFISAAVPMIREQAQLFDDVKGVLMEVPEYEDPLMLEHQLSAMGAMPIFTLLDSAKKQADYKEDDISEKLKIAQSKKIIDDVINRLQTSRSKLDKGASNIYVDLEKSIQSLKKLEKISRPDAHQVLSSLQALLSMAKPLMVYDAKELATTNKPEVIVEKPLNYDSRAIAVRVITTEKPILNEKPVFDDKSIFDDKPVIDNEPVFDKKSVVGKKSVLEEKSSSDEKSIPEETISEPQELKVEREEEKSMDEIHKPVNSGYVKRTQEFTKKPYEPEANLKDEKSPENEELMSYKAKFSWKSAGML